ncbi:cytochrome c oxidase subunit 3 [Pseudoxanthomonas taiwanensis]|jgi:Heme/copper-type cytochrome/quinol oxidase, subunit 3|uniref:cytochrome-c oxidase n=1 Tax=Pseudoxanthomonas taiwanensis TaxID=176598 RepID=A0A921NX23_9GAMM|nr:cytochrome c oxidase subunit 3 [Pseudoxanthomonas taiwanensis]KAF1690272.1 cytochrome c oxidase subunit 3 [Pseudoxanthomonas taiwanensis]MBO2466626.1 cytochrome c oxidase subunit 3 [Xanthomonadaceae bacterium]
MAQHPTDANVYFVPAKSKAPIFASVSMFVLMIGAATWMNDLSWGKWAFAAGVAMMVATLFYWFGEVVRESQSGYYNRQVDVSFRMGMIWFIFSEVMFFGAFFGALFYTRQFALPWLGGEGDGVLTNELLWNGFSAAWPTSGPGQVGGQFQTIPAWGLPLINTLILLTSGVTLTIAHHALKGDKRGQLLFWLGATVALGVLFLYLQGSEYIHAYTELNLTLRSGIYGSTFFMLTGFHGAHVALGTIMLLVMWFRSARGHFTRDRHFAFEAAAWYWHFVDVVWLALFLFVYVV